MTKQTSLIKPPAHEQSQGNRPGKLTEGLKPVLLAQKLILYPNVAIYIITRCITKTCLYKYTENFTTKNWNFSDENNLIVFIFLLKT